MAPRRVLLVCHRSAVVAAAEAAAAVWPDAERDVLAYGRSADALPAPCGTRLLTLPPFGVPRASAVLGAAQWLLSLRRRRYEVAAIAQPSLGLSRARGLLVAFPKLIGRRAVVLDPEVRQIRRGVGWPLAVVEVLRWIAWQALAVLVSRAATIALTRREPAPRPARSLPTGGAVVYLRTDIDLATQPLLAGGSAAHTEGIIAALQRRGHRVELRSTGFIAGVPDAVAVRSLPVTLRGNVPTEIAELASGLVQALRAPAPPPDLAFVYQRYSLDNLAGLILARRWKVPLVLEANGSEAKWRTDWSTVRFPALAFACERLLLRGADRVPVVSRNAARDLLAAGARAADVRVVPNGVDVERFAAAEPAALPFDDGAFVIAFTGLFYPWHGVRFLAEAFALLHERLPDARLLLIGDGEEAPVVAEVLREADCLDRVHMPGLVPRDAVPGYLAAADVVVAPHAAVRDFIGSPIKLFEYLASGRPVVASRVAQIGDVITDGETGVLVEPEDPAALAAALERLHADPALRARLGAAAQAEAREQHSWDARLEAILE